MRHVISFFKNRLFLLLILPLLKSCSPKPSTTDISPIIGNYAYTTSKTMGGYKIKGNWKLNITKNSPGNYSYFISKTITDEMYGAQPKTEVYSGNFSSILNNEHDLQLIGYGNSYISIPYDGFLEAPDQITLYGDGDPKYFIREESVNKEQSDSKPPPDISDTRSDNPSDTSFDPIQFLTNRSDILEVVFKDIYYDYALIRPLNHNRFSELNNSNISLLSNKFLSKDSECSTYLSDIKNGSPLYEIYFARVHTGNRFAEGGLTED